MDREANVHPTFCQAFQVSFEYPVVFSRDIFCPANLTLLEVFERSPGRSPRRCVFYADANLVQASPDFLARVHRYFAAHAGRLELAGAPVVLAGGEVAKRDWTCVEPIVDRLIEAHLCRHSFVAVAGGGALLDAVGFAAALVHRGLRLVRLPTTVLAQNDAGVGVKNAIDYRGGKNLLGTFAPPFAVINDFEFIKTAPISAWRDGIAEAFKVAVIKDAVFFDDLCRMAADLARRRFAVMEELIYRTARLHLLHIQQSGDPFESNRAKPLDFGHWSAHQLEVMSGFQITHGQAVSVGLMLDATYAFLSGWLDADELARIRAGLRAADLPIWHPLMERRLPDGRLELLLGLDRFREHLGGELSVTLPHGLGAHREVSEMDGRQIEQALASLKDGLVSCCGSLGGTG
jgi:3-dehydroquinate synthase